MGNQSEIKGRKSGKSTKGSLSMGKWDTRSQNLGGQRAFRFTDKRSTPSFAVRSLRSGLPGHVERTSRDGIPRGPFLG